MEAVIQSEDLAVLLRLALEPHRRWCPETVADALFLSPAALDAALARAAQAGLYSRHRGAVLVTQLVEFVLHGVRYVFPAEVGVHLVRGMPTSVSAPPLRDRLLVGGGAECVWPDPAGELVGHPITPLHPRAVDICRADPRLWRLLALVDALRVGRARERTVGEPLLRQELAA